MRAQDANRRRPLSSDAPRDTMSPKPMSSPRHSLTSSPCLPTRNIIQSASVCDLSAPNMWNPELHQVSLLLARKYYSVLGLDLILKGSLMVTRLFRFFSIWTRTLSILKNFNISFAGPIISTSRSSNDLVPDWQSLGTWLWWIHHEPQSSTHVGVPHGLSSTSNVTSSLPWNSLKAAQSCTKCQIHQEV